MTQPVFNFQNKHIHFVGIGGCGMSGLATLAQQAGAHCTGSDRINSAIIDQLRDRGIHVILEQTADSVPQGTELLVVSAAIPADHPERQTAAARGIEIIKYAQMLGRIMQGRTGIAMAGTHGKSSTTSMLAHLLIQTGLDPSFIIGANCPQIGGGSRTGSSDILLAEACEYDRSFHALYPTHAAILNVEADHLDIYKSIDEIVEAFAQFARRVPEHGTLFIQHESPHRLTITAGLNCKVRTVGYAPQADYRIVKNNGHTQLLDHGQLLADWPSPIPGEHMASNAGFAMTLAHHLGADMTQAAKAMGEFRGLDRRMQLKGVRVTQDTTGNEQRVTVIDDYGHHPTEIDTTLRALKSHYDPARLVCIFQPHQHSRTRFLLNEFAASFSQADLVIVPQIYFVRDSEAEKQAVTAGDLVDRLREKGVQAMHLYPFDAIVEQLLTIARDGDLVVVMGAGDVWQVAEQFIKA